MFDASPLPETHALQQDPAFLAALRACGQTPVELPGGLLVPRRRLAGIQLAMLPRALPPEDLTAQLAAVGLHRLPLILSPERPCRMPRALRICAPRPTTVIDLTPDETTRRALLHPKWRNQLCRAEDGPLHVAHGPFRPDDPLLGLEAAQARDRGYASWPPPLTAAFARAAPHQTRLFTARLKGTPVAHMLFLTHGNRATYHIGHTTEAGRRENAHNLLLWRACSWLALHGHVSLDTGLMQPTVPGLDRFKLRAGAKPQMMGGTWLRWRPLARGPGP